MVSLIMIFYNMNGHHLPLEGRCCLRASGSDCPFPMWWLHYGSRCGVMFKDEVVRSSWGVSSYLTSPKVIVPESSLADFNGSLHLRRNGRPRAMISEGDSYSGPLTEATI